MMTPTMNLSAGPITDGGNVGDINSRNIVLNSSSYYKGNVGDINSHNIVLDPYRNVGSVNSYNIVSVWSYGERSVGLASWVSNLDFSSYQSEAYERYTEGTLLWALKEPEFVTWLDSDGGILWCPGKPGSGKTVFASFIIDYLQKTVIPHATVCYIYCRYDTTPSRLQLFEAVLAQLILNCPFMNIQRVQAAKDRGQRLNLKDILSILQETFDNVPNIFLVFDALDECFDEVTRYRILFNLQSLTSVKILITSRPLPSGTEGAIGSARRLVISANDEDIKKAFQAEIEINPRLKELVSQVSDRAIEAELVEKADGSFLLAGFHIRSLAAQTNVNELLHALQVDTLPQEVTASYEETLDRIFRDPTMRRLAFRMLSGSHALPRLGELGSSQSTGLDIGILGNEFYGTNNRVGNDNISIGAVLGNVSLASRPTPESVRIPLANWLSILDMSRLQAEAFERRTEGTFSWILETSEYTSWKKQEIGGTLLCIGKPGAGKTTFASFVIHTLLQQKDSDPNVVAAVCYFYCRHDKTFTILQLFEVLLKQLVLQCSSANIDALQKLKEEERRPTLREIISILGAIATHVSSIFIVIDAMDELDSDDVRHRIIRKLRSLTSIKTLMTSRALPSMEGVVQGVPVLTISPNTADLHTYFRAQAPETSNLGKLTAKLASTGTDVEAKLIEQADGMFLLAQLHVSYLSAQTNEGAFRQALDTLPKEASGIYARALERIDQQADTIKQLALRVLSWVYHAIRPLSVIELRYGVAIGKLEDMPDETNLDDEALLISSCAGLLTVNKETKEVTFIHYTVRQYLQEIKGKLLPSVHITQCCMRVVSLRDARLNPPNHPLLEYAAGCWGILVCLNEVEETVANPAISHLNNPAKVNLLLSGIFKASSGNALHLIARFGLARVGKCFFERDPQFLAQKDEEGTAPLHLAAAFGHLEIVKMLLEKGVEVDMKDNKCRTPLSLAAEQGQFDVACILLNSGQVDVNSSDVDEWTPLHWAASAGHLDVLKLLVSRPEANIEKRNRKGRSPGLQAASKGHVRIIQFLAEMGVDLSAEDAKGRRLLFRAAREGHLELVKFLAKKVPDDINHKDLFGYTPLALAAANGHLTVVQFLASKEVDLSAEDRDGATPFLLAASAGHLEVVRFLEEKVALDKDRKNKLGRTPLAMAAANGHLPVVKYLVSEDGNLNAKDESGITPLLLAASLGRLEVVQFLTEQLPHDLNHKDKLGGTALGHAAANGHLSVVQFLASKEVDLLSQNNNGMTPLSEAASYGHFEVVKFLAEKIPQALNQVNHRGFTPLAIAAVQGHLSIAEFLTSKSANLSAVNMSGSTPLTLAASGGHLEVLMFLLEKVPQDMEHKDNFGCTPLAIAAAQGHPPIVQFLASRGADLNVQSSGGATPLFLAASYGHLDIVKFFVEKVEQDIDRPGTLGRTPLCEAAFNGHAHVVEYLITTNKANLNSRDQELQDTPLLRAVSQGHLNVVSVLLDINEVDVRARNQQGATAVLLAAENGHFLVLNHLLDHPRIRENTALQGIHPIKRIDSPDLRRPNLIILRVKLHRLLNQIPQFLAQLKPSRLSTPSSEPRAWSSLPPRPWLSSILVITSIVALVLTVKHRKSRSISK